MKLLARQSRVSTRILPVRLRLRRPHRQQPCDLQENKVEDQKNQQARLWPNPFNNETDEIVGNIAERVFRGGRQKQTLFFEFQIGCLDHIREHIDVGIDLFPELLAGAPTGVYRHSLELVADP